MWYKKANLYDEIRRFGPQSLPVDFWENRSIEEIQQIFPNIDEQTIRKIKQDPYLYSLEESKMRQKFVTDYSWAVPTQKAIQEIKNFTDGQTILEVGSGLGLWAKLLQDEGINIIPTNIPISDKEKYFNVGKKPFTKIEYLSHLESIQSYPETAILMLSWPPCDDIMAYELLKRFKGSKLIFIGEGKYGCTAEDNFFDLLENTYVLYKTVEIPRWRNIYDDLFLYIRKT